MTKREYENLSRKVAITVDTTIRKSLTGAPIFVEEWDEWAGIDNSDRMHCAKNRGNCLDSITAANELINRNARSLAPQ